MESILDKNMEYISIANKILQDPSRSYKILQDLLLEKNGFYGILEKNAMESISIANKILQDPKDSTGYLTKMVWNPYQ